MQPFYDYLPDGTRVKTKKGINTFWNGTPNYVNFNSSWNPPFEKAIIGSHRKVLFGRRIITGFAYYAYFLLALQCVIGLMTTDFTFSGKTVFFISILASLVVFVATEAYTDIRTTMFSMTSIMAELIVRGVCRNYNAMDSINASWKQSGHRGVSHVLRHGLRDDRDGILFVYSSDKTSNMYMKMTYIVVSPSMNSLWSKAFPSLCKNFSVKLDGGVVHGVHNTSLGSTYSVVSSMDFVMARDNMLSGFTKYVLNAFSFNKMKNLGMPLCEVVSDSIHDKTENFKTKHELDNVFVKTSLAHNVNDYGFIDISGYNFHVCFEVDRISKSLKVIKNEYLGSESFDLA